MRIVVPASTSNIGPGFDVMGIALKLYNSFEIEEIDCGLEIKSRFPEFNNESNLVYRTMKKVFSITGYRPRGIRIVIDDRVPVSRGLGSSGTCVIAGVIAALEISRCKWSNSDVLDIATDIEGHPDNIAPSLLGGIRISVKEDRVVTRKVENGCNMMFYSLIPDFRLSTKQAREVLPDNVSMEDAVYNIGRMALLINAISSGDCECLKTALRDRLHQSFRGDLIDHYHHIVSRVKELDTFGCFISGAGPTLMVPVIKGESCPTESLRSILAENSLNWDIVPLEVEEKGVEVN